MFEDSNHKGWMYAAYGVMIAAAFLMYLRLGSYPMQMQWEPNYGQVLREMVWGEGDAITPASRVGNDEGAAYGWFWSKPILIFWLSYPLMAAFGSPDQVPTLGYSVSQTPRLACWASL
jgi:4-amino-4-deoxy-L-arabinose transferase-like glycosyltransferase